ncbi:hypothetical protein FSP39_023158 [Pinctada imbricata]|uniref:L-seryl-tRNA(Sec) kinase n=1 Tax=Pinctada imbricata TaxID=66713 RepID=A0AA88YAI8_PINIB|nr:hypothetical protein FSP39_023158 [Pinctada imbricata]
MSSQACVLVLCGIPASGKSTTAKNLQQYFDDRIKEGSFDQESTQSQGWMLSKQDTICVIVSYDELISEDLEQKLIENEEEMKWKAQREVIINCVDDLLCYFLKNRQQGESEISSQEKTVRSDSQSNKSDVESDIERIGEFKSSDENLDSEFTSVLSLGEGNEVEVQDFDGRVQCEGNRINQQQLENSSQAVASLLNEKRSIKKNENETDDDLKDCMDKDYVTIKSEDDEEIRKMRNEFSCKITSNMKRKLAENKFSNLVVAIDDNMYYSSMRYKYYQLARKYTCGFCQVCFDIDVNTTLSRNECRKVRKITDDVIVTMAMKLEIPDPKKNSWEEHSLIINAEKIMVSDNISDVVSCIKSAMDDPVMPIPEVEESIKEEDRRISRENLLHQADQVIRKLIKQTMVKAKDDKCSQQKMKSLSKELTVVKGDLLRDIKEGRLLADFNMYNCGSGLTSCDTKLFVTLSEIFHQRIL